MTTVTAFFKYTFFTNIIIIFTYFLFKKLINLKKNKRNNFHPKKRVAIDYPRTGLDHYSGAWNIIAFFPNGSFSSILRFSLTLSTSSEFTNFKN